MQLNSFNELGLAAPITRALAEENYTVPTPIQKEAIPHVLTRRDLVGIAQTGTGKTAAFALPILNHLLTQPMRREPRFCRVLVLSPTRELSGQILESFRTYGRHVRPTRCARHRRRPDEPSNSRAVGRRRRAGRHPRPAARPDAQPRRPARSRRGLRARRGRPHARHGLHPRYPRGRRQAAGAAPDAVLLGHHAGRDRVAGRQAAARSRPRRRDAGRQDRRPGRSAHHAASTRPRRADCSPIS